MNFGTMKAALERYGFTADDPLDTWLNAALHEIEGSFDWPFLEEGPLTLLLPAGTLGQPYYLTGLPSDVAKIISIFDLDHLAKIKYWSRRKFRRLIQDQTDQGLMEVYTLIGTSNVQLWRVPQTPTNVEVLYQGITSDMANSADVPTTGITEWPVIMHYGIVMRAASIALQAENEEDRAKTAQSEFDNWLLRMMGRFGERELDDVETVEDEQGYGDDMPLRGIAGW